MQIEIRGIAEYFSKPTQLYRVRKKETVYGASRNIRRPKIHKGKYGNVKNQKLKNYCLVDERTTLIKDEVTDKIINKHKTEIYKRKENYYNSEDKLFNRIIKLFEEY